MSNHPLAQAASLSLGSLAEVAKWFDEIDTVAERRAAAEKVDAVLAREVDDAAKALVPAKAELAKVEGELRKQQRILDDQRLRAANDLDAKIAKAQGELNALTARIAKAQAELTNLTASFGGLHHRLHLGER